VRSPAEHGRRAAAWGIAAVVVAIVVSLPATSGAPNPTLPVALGSRFVGNVSAPSLTAGDSGTMSFTLHNPLNGTIRAISLSLQLYNFSAFPGGASGSGTLSDPPVLSTPTSAGLWANFTWASLAAGASISPRGTVGVTTSSVTPLGAYAVRFALRFTGSNGTVYLLESRGWFPAALWAEATSGPNGTTELTSHSLELLNVSGVLPETSIQVTGSSLDIALYVILAVALVLTGFGAYVYFRRTRRHARSGT
jgi:hypothetical protein